MSLDLPERFVPMSEIICELWFEKNQTWKTHNNEKKCYPGFLKTQSHKHLKWQSLNSCSSFHYSGIAKLKYAKYFGVNQGQRKTPLLEEKQNTDTSSLTTEVLPSDWKTSVKMAASAECNITSIQPATFVACHAPFSPPCYLSSLFVHPIKVKMPKLMADVLNGPISNRQ